MADTHGQTLAKLIQIASGATEAVADAEREADWNIPTYGATTSETYAAELDDLHEPLADLFIRLSGKRQHASDCATSSAPARMPGPCDCEFSA